MKKVIRLGKQMEWHGVEKLFNVYCKIEIKEGRLSISGVIGPFQNGNAAGSCGQIYDSIKIHPGQYAPGWNGKKVKAFIELWKRWHLNDCTAGSPKQEEYLRANPVKYEYPQSHYDAALIALAAAGLQPDKDYIHNDKPYSYGSAWLKEELPQSVMDELNALPETDQNPAWV